MDEVVTLVLFVSYFMSLPYSICVGKACVPLEYIIHMLWRMAIDGAGNFSHSFYGLKVLLSCTWSVTLSLSGNICIGSVYRRFWETRGWTKRTCAIPFIRSVFSSLRLSFFWPLSGMKVKGKLQVCVIYGCVLKAYREAEYIPTLSNLDGRWKRELNALAL